jgi:hypothetical protein
MHADVSFSAIMRRGAAVGHGHAASWPSGSTTQSDRPTQIVILAWPRSNAMEKSMIALWRPPTPPGDPGKSTKRALGEPKCQIRPLGLPKCATPARGIAARWHADRVTGRASSRQRTSVAVEFYDLGLTFVDLAQQPCNLPVSVAHLNRPGGCWVKISAGDGPPDNCRDPGPGSTALDGVTARQVHAAQSR